MPDRSPDGPEEMLPDDVVQRVIARAIELDTLDSSSMPITRLRQIASESGISSDAIEQALRESRMSVAFVAPSRNQRPSFLRRLWHRFVDGTQHESAEEIPDQGLMREVLEGTATNVITFAAWWLPFFYLNGLVHSLGYFRTGASSDAFVLVGALLGVALAIRVRARIMAWFVGIMCIGITVSIISALGSGWSPLRRLGSTGMISLIAAALGMLVGVLVMRRRRVSQGTSQPPGGTQDADQWSSRPKGTPAEKDSFLRLQIQPREAPLASG